nr:3D domain-containing protein [Paenibacillus turpanensis]
MIALFLILMSYTDVKKVTIVVDGQQTVVHTELSEVSEVLKEHNIAFSEHDRISKGAEDEITNGDTVTITHAVPVELTVGGQTETKYTVGKTVQEALTDLGITVGELDKVFPSLDAPITEKVALQVVRVEKKVEQLQETIPFQTVTKKDTQLVKGKEQVVQEGKEGLLVKEIENVYEDGVLVAQNVLQETVQSESVNKVVAVGTKSPVVVLSSSSPNIDQATKSGVTFGYKQILKNVTLTAYSAGVESTGKDESHPQYGKTFSGTTVTEGRTIAVDPKVIPMGWWVYIDGIGFRRAEDKGSAVKGNHIDVYFDSGDYASRFGMKKGYTVYVIGPTKPATN